MRIQVKDFMTTSVIAAVRTDKVGKIREIMKTENLLKHIEKLDLNKVEPFTMVIVDWNEGLNLYQLVWDENEKLMHGTEVIPCLAR